MVFIETSWVREGQKSTFFDIFIIEVSNRQTWAFISILAVIFHL